MSKVYERSSDGAVDFNMTPMIDVTFQLILFFILAGSFASEVLAKIEVPKPDFCQAEEDKGTGVDKIIVNVVSMATVGDDNIDPYEAGKAQLYKIGKQSISPGPGSPQEIRRAIEAVLRPLSKERRKNFFLVVRADRRVHFSDVLPVLTAAVQAGVSKMRITAVLEAR